jgi:hypothetical protein
MGKSDNTTVLSGAAMEEAEFSNLIETLQSKQQIIALQIFQSFLCLIFGDHERGETLALEQGDRVIKESLGLSVTMLDPFVRGMSVYAMAQKTGRRKYRIHASKARKTIATWVGKGNPNVYHQLKLMDAEKEGTETQNQQEKDIPSLRCSGCLCCPEWVHPRCCLSERATRRILAETTPQRKG